MDDRQDLELACVAPAVGDRILDLTLRTIDADERRLLEAHADACALCRLTLDLEHRLGEGIRDGSLTGKELNSSSYRRQRGWTGWIAVAATAASLACLLMLPPRPIGPSVAVRGSGEPGFLRPVEGEVITGNEMTIAWADVPGADLYRVRITEIQTGETRTEATRETRLLVKSGSGPSSDRTYRILLSTEPSDLLPPGGVSVVYRSGGLFEVIIHRAKMAQPVTYAMAFVGLVFAGMFVIGLQKTQHRENRV